MKRRLCGPEGYCNARVLRGESLARCAHCQACETAIQFWSRLFPVGVLVLLCAASCGGIDLIVVDADCGAPDPCSVGPGCSGVADAGTVK